MKNASLAARTVSMLGAAFLTVVMLAAVDTLAVSDAPSGLIARATVAARA